MGLMITFTTIYMYDQLIGINKRNKKNLYLFLIPSFLLLILMICFIGQLDFLKGTTTNYSMGISVYISYISLIIHYGLLLFVLLTRYRFFA